MWNNYARPDKCRLGSVVLHMDVSLMIFFFFFAQMSVVFDMSFDVQFSFVHVDAICT